MQISFRKVNYMYGQGTPYETLVLKDIDLEIEVGTYTAVIGKTGSGKSTLIENINGLLIPTSGSITINNIVLEKKKKKKEKKLLEESLWELRKDVAILFQLSEQQLFETTVLKDIIFAPLNYGIKRDEAEKKARALIKSIGLDESFLEKSPFELSGGEMRKVALCGILVLEPKIIILDEPTIGLDNKSKKEIMEFVKTLHNRGITVILITHQMDYVLEYADKVLVMKDGKIEYTNTPINLFSDSNTLEKYSLDTPDFIKMYNDLKNKGIKFTKYPKNQSEFLEIIKTMIRGKVYE